MGIHKDELVLYSISLLEDDNRPNIRVDRNTLSSALNIAESTLNTYLSQLRKLGYIKRIKRKFPRDILDSVKLTDDGRNQVKLIKNKIDKEVFTPERHNLPSCISVSTILNQVNDPLEKIFSLSFYTMSKRFDFNLLIKTMRTARINSSIVNVISNISGKVKKNDSNLMETFYKTSMISDFNIKDMGEDQIDWDNPDMMLIMAEATYKQCKLEESRSLYRYILSPKMQLSHTHWFIASCGLALVTSKIGEIEKSIEMLQDIINITDNKVLKAYARERMARILSTTHEHAKAEELFRSCIASYRSFQIPLLLTWGYNNYAVLLFRRGRYDEAETYWNAARKTVKETGSNYLEGPIFGNLADIEIQKGNLELSEKYLLRGREAYQQVCDIEGESYIDFNYSLLYLEKKDKVKALEYFDRFQTIAYPSPSPKERDEMLAVFLERAEKNGIEDILSMRGSSNSDHDRDNG